MTDGRAEQIGDLEPVRLLGTGNLGETWVYRHRTTGKQVAVKLIHARLAADPGFAQRFQRTIARAAAVRHERVAALESFGLGQRPYVVSEWVQGGSVRDLLEARRDEVPLALGAEIVRQAAEGLAALHARQLVHRDVKPENLLLARELAERDEQQVKLNDAGFSALLESDMTVGAMISGGSLAYLSPEQCRGQTPDGRSDLYSLGVVLYELATGYPPFQATTLGDAVAKHLNVQPPAPSQVARRVPPALEAIVLKCLQKDPGQRFQSAEELATALAGLIPQLRAAEPATPEIEIAPARPAGGIRVKVPGAGGQAPPKPAGGPIKVHLNAPGTPAAPAAKAPTPAAPPPTPPAASPPPIREEELGFGETVVVRRERPPEERPPERKPAAAFQSKRIRVTVDREVLQVMPGQDAIVVVTLMNAGRTVDHYTLGIDGIPASWLRLPPAPTRLNPGERATVPLTIAVPRTPEARAGDYVVNLTASSRDTPGEAGMVTCRWTVLPFSATRLEVAPGRTRGWRRGKYQVSVRNDGNCGTAVTLSAADEERRLLHRFTPAALQLEPGQGTTVALQVDAPLKAFGMSSTWGLSVRAKSESAATQGGRATDQPAQQAQFVQRPIIPAWILPILLILAALGGWYVTMKRQRNVEIVKKTATMTVGDDFTFEARVLDGFKDVVPGVPVRWTSSDSSTAVVSDSGTVEAAREGQVVISAIVGRKTQEIQVTIVSARVQTVALAPSAPMRLKPGDTRLLRATAKDKDGQVVARKIQWSSSDASVATIGPDGSLVAKGPGKTVISAQADEAMATVAVAVDSIKVAGPPPEPPPEECIDYDAAALAIKKGKSGWSLLMNGGVELKRLDNKDDAEAARLVARQFTRYCTLGRKSKRPSPSQFLIEFWQGGTGATTALKKQDCVDYDQKKLTIQAKEPDGVGLMEGKKVLLWADNEKDAKRIWQEAVNYTSMCFIGKNNKRPDRREYTLQYWR